MKQLVLLVFTVFSINGLVAQCLDCEKDSLSILYSNYSNKIKFAKEIEKLQPTGAPGTIPFIIAKTNSQAMIKTLFLKDQKNGIVPFTWGGFVGPDFTGSYGTKISFVNDTLDIEFTPVTGTSKKWRYSLEELSGLADFIETEKTDAILPTGFQNEISNLADRLDKIEEVYKGVEEVPVSSGFSSLKLSDFGGSAWQQQVIFGLTDFLLERAKKEINASFIQAFKDVLTKDPEVEKFFDKVFPKTMKIINNFDDYDVKNILPEFKKAIEIDYQAFPYSFPDYTAYLLNRYSKENGSKALNYVSASLYVLSDFNKSIINGTNPIQGLMCGIHELDKEKLSDTVLLKRIKLIKSIYCFRDVYMDEKMQEDYVKYFKGNFRTHVKPDDSHLTGMDIDKFEDWSAENREKFTSYWMRNRRPQFMSGIKGVWIQKFLELYEKDKATEEFVLNQLNLNAASTKVAKGLVKKLLSDFNSIWSVYDEHKITLNSLRDELGKQTELSKVNLYKDSIRQEKFNLTINILPHGVNMLETVLHFSVDQLEDELDEENRKYWKNIITVSSDGVNDMIIPLLKKDYSAMVVNGIDLLSNLMEAMNKKEEDNNGQSLEQAVAHSKLTKGIDGSFYEAQLTLVQTEIERKVNIEKNYYDNYLSSKHKKQLKSEAKHLNWKLSDLEKSALGKAYSFDLKTLDSLKGGQITNFIASNKYSSGMMMYLVGYADTADQSAFSDPQFIEYWQILSDLRVKTQQDSIQKIATVLGVSFGKKEDSSKDAVKAISQVGKLLSFTANVAKAEDHEQVQAALESFMDPVGGFKHKRLKKDHKFYASLNSYIGWNFNMLDYSKVDNRWQNNKFSMAPSLNLGVEFGWTVCDGFNIGIYTSIIELGALASFRLDGNDFDSVSYDIIDGVDTTTVNYTIGSNSTQNITFEQIFAPSIALSFGITKKFPLTLQLGYRFSPNVWNYSFKSNQLEYQSKFNAHQIFFGVTFDLTLYRFTRRL